MVYKPRIGLSTSVGWVALISTTKTLLSMALITGFVLSLAAARKASWNRPRSCNATLISRSMRGMLDTRPLVAVPTIEGEY